MGKRLIVYSGGLDGWCSAAIAALDARDKGLSAGLLELGHGETFPWEALAGFVPDQDELWLLDLSPAPVAMGALRAKAGFHLVWMDHSPTAIRDLAAHSDLAGARSAERASCQLAWSFCHPGTSFPWVVRAIADRSSGKFRLGDDTHHYCAYLSALSPDPRERLESFWLPELACFDRPEPKLSLGKTFHAARMRDLRRIALSLGQPEEGPDFSILTVNFPGSPEMGRTARDLGFDVCHCFVEKLFDGRPARVHSLYSDQVDVSGIARKNGGGGRRNAAGWTERGPAR
ncbi:MAG: hypothetical protein AB1921_02775 [Thermodesulfobacteriota bacterium]